MTDNKQVEEHLLPADRTRWVSEREMRDGLIPAKHGWDEFNLVGDFKRVLMQGFTAHVYDDLGVKSVHKVWLDDVHLRLYAAVEKRTRLMCDDDEDDAGGSTGDEHGLELNDISDVKRGTRCHHFAVARANLGALAAARELPEECCLFLVTSERTLALRVGSARTRDHLVHMFRKCLNVLVVTNPELLRARGLHGIVPMSDRIKYMHNST